MKKRNSVITISLIFLPITLFSFFDNFNQKENSLWNIYLSYFPNNPNNVSVKYRISDKNSSDGYALMLIYPKNANFPNPSYGPNIESKEWCWHGIYKAKIKSPEISNLKVGMVSGFFVYFNDVWINPLSPTDANNNGIADSNEIDFEFLSAEKDTIYMTVWSDYQENPVRFRKVTRKVNIRTGEIQQTPKGLENTFALSYNGKISVTIPDFDHSKKYYEYKFIWQPERVKFYISDQKREILLWDFNQTDIIPKHKAKIMVNLWHNDTHWHKGNSTIPPDENAVLMVDWIEYIPLEGGDK